MQKFRSLYLQHIAIFLFFLIGAIYITFPMIFHLNEFVPGIGDELYITWIINWNIHALTTNILNLFQGNIYYPYQNTLSFSDLHLASSLLAFIPVKITGEPLIAYTLNLILALCLLGFSVYCLVYFLTKDTFSSILAGTACCFSTFFIPKFGQLQVTSIYWIPFSLLSYFAFIKFKKYRYFLISISLFYLQFINSFMPAYFLLLFLISLTFYEIFKNKKSFTIFANRKTLISLFILFLFCIPIIYPYYQTSISQHYVRDIRDAIQMANRPEYFFYNFGGSFIAPYITSFLYKKPGPFLYDGYRGFVTTLLTFFVLIYFFLKKKKPKYFNLFTLVGLSSYILSLGPAFQLNGHVIKTPFIIPLPYALFYYLAPGFQGFRNSGRIEVYEIMAFCIAAGILISNLFLRKKLLKNSVIVFLCFLIFSEYNFPFHFVKLPSKKNLPPIYNYLKTVPQTTIIAEFPIYNWNMFPYSFTENKRLYFSSFDFVKTLDGGGGFSPYKWQFEVTTLAKNFPNDNSITILKSIGVNHIVVHFDEFDNLFNNKFLIEGYRIPNGKMVKNTLDRSNNLMLVKNFENTSFYEIK